MWTILRVVSKGEYNYAVVPEHPRATKNGYVLEHRIVMENKLGRLLRDDEVVHHKDENKKRNDLDNLELKTKQGHARDHGLQRGMVLIALVCPGCSVQFNRRRGSTHLVAGRGKFTSCSSRCRDKFVAQMRLEGLSHDVQTKLAANVGASSRRFIALPP